MAKKISKSDAGDSKVYAFLAAFLGIIGFIIALLAWKDDKYAMYYAKQSLGVFIAAVIVGIAGLILVWIPILGWLVMLLANVGIVILWLITWINALSGMEKQTPIVGKHVESIKL